MNTVACRSKRSEEFRGRSLFSPFVQSFNSIVVIFFRVLNRPFKSCKDCGRERKREEIPLCEAE